MKNFFRTINSFISEIKNFVEDTEERELDRKRERLRKLKIKNGKREEKENLDRELEFERKRFSKKEDGWF